jgi:hypothetical protein
MIKRIVIGALGFMVVTLVASGLEARSQKELRGSATWTVDPPAPCGPFSSLLVHSTTSDASVVEVIYQSGNTCDNSFQILQGSAAGSVTGSLKRLRMEALVPTSDGRTFDVDITLTGTKDLADKSPREKVVSARATGSVLLDGVDLTGGVATDNATITETKVK